ncbi:MAG: 23S rRNA (adenine(2503)-C(2))-methyltransferase RlmN, partial [Deltaproteobacteria bacterium]|nr:23S rRNA (adenine(2503)-C(2))-methyltransferase RlmN [Deltaproteobacteria bacterium]
MIALLYPKPVVKLKPNITDFSEDELKDWAQQKNEKPFRVNQLLQWLYHHRASSFDQMSNLSKDFRSKLSDFFSFQLPEIVKTQEADDGTIKFLQKLSDQSHIESVLLKHDDHNTLCISTQVGCGMGCRFCLTGKMGLKRNLSSGEIVEQVLNAYRLIPPGETIRNIVYMGMGEPFHNYDNTIKSLGTLLNPLGFDASARRITVSTCGLIPEIKRFAREKFKANLAVSLNGVYE